MPYQFKIKRNESLIYILIWTIIFLSPVFFTSNDSRVNWNLIGREWVRLIPFLLIFSMHNYILFPTFFVKSKKAIYLLSTLMLIIGISFLGERLVISIENIFELRPMPAPFEEDFPPIEGRRGPHPGSWPKHFFNNILISTLLIGFNASIKLSVIWQDEEQKNKELEKEKLKTELAFLKNQISPHFFMNTLNNIHALIDINSENAKESIIKLSKLMRYLLYDSEEGKTTLDKEVQFIQNYVELMKLRYTSNVKVTLAFPEKIPALEIPPMLFTSLIENAFKHGVSYQKPSFIEVVINLDSSFLYFRIKNSVHTHTELMDEKGGIGLENLEKRLQLIYKNRFSMNISEQDNYFQTIIKLPLDG